MKRVVLSAGAVVIGIALFAGLGSSDARASDNARFRSLNDRRMSSSAGVEHRRISSLNDRRATSSPGTKATKFATLWDRRCKTSSRTLIARDVKRQATGR